MDRPLAYNLKMLRRWLTHSAHGNSFLIYPEQDTWDKAFDYDFLAIPKANGDCDKDALSQLFLGPLVELYHMLVGRFYKVFGPLAESTHRDRLSIFTMFKSA